MSRLVIRNSRKKLDVKMTDRRFVFAGTVTPPSMTKHSSIQRRSTFARKLEKAKNEK